MTTLLQCHHISHHAGTKSLFSDLNLTIKSNDRIGLVGHNGSGKSTLFSLLMAQETPDSGDISRSNSLSLECVEQFINPDLTDLSLVEALGIKLPDEERAFGEYRVEMLLSQLGFSESEFGHKVDDLSGGQQNRLMFARAVINNPDLILFDEPTNHLDLRTLLYFEAYLRQMDAAYVLISHDREFLDAVTSRTLFLRDQTLHKFDLPYSQARQQLDERDEAAFARRQAEEKNIKSLQASAKRLATWGKVYDNEKFAAKAKSMEKRIEKLEEKKTEVTRGSGLSLSLEVQHSRANRMLQIEKFDVIPPGVSSNPLFHIEEFLIRPGDRIALLGKNGAGKTTLINQMLQNYHADQPHALIRFNPQCQIGYYDQELQALDGSRSITEILRDACPGSEGDHKSALIKAGFPYLDLAKKVAVLSGGEKARLMFLLIKLNRPNFLILDEPTNHIDIQGKEELEQQIIETNATVLITSHDRRFVDTIAERFVLIQHGKLRELHEPAEFYRDFEGVEQNSNPAKLNNTFEADNAKGTLDEEGILERIVELEYRLAADLARKPKFQKPALQQQWQTEIELLQLNLS